MTGVAWFGLIWRGLACFALMALALLYWLDWLGLLYHDSYQDSSQFLPITHWPIFETHYAYLAYCLIRLAYWLIGLLAYRLASWLYWLY